MPVKRSEDALIVRQRVAESFGFQFEYRGQSQGFASVKMSLNTDKGVFNLLIRDAHFMLRKPTDKDYTRWPLIEFEGMLEEIFTNYKNTERDQIKEGATRNIPYKTSGYCDQSPISFTRATGFNQLS